MNLNTEQVVQTVKEGNLYHASTDKYQLASNHKALWLSGYDFMRFFVLLFTGTGDAEKMFAVGIGKILFRTSWKNKHAGNAYQLLETMSEYDEKSIQRLFLAKEKLNKASVVFSELHGVISCYINGCNILQACRVLNSLVDEEWDANFWRKTSNSLKWRKTILDLGKRLSSAGYLTECLQLLRNLSQGE